MFKIHLSYEINSGCVLYKEYKLLSYFLYVGECVRTVSAGVSV